MKNKKYLYHPFPPPKIPSFFVCVNQQRLNIMPVANQKCGYGPRESKSAIYNDGLSPTFLGLFL